MEDPRLGTEFKPQLQPIPQLQQRQILQPTVPGQGSNHTSTSALTIAVISLTYCTMVGTLRIPDFYIFMFLFIDIKMNDLWVPAVAQWIKDAVWSLGQCGFDL